MVNTQPILLANFCKTNNIKFKYLNIYFEGTPGEGRKGFWEQLIKQILLQRDIKHMYWKNDR